MLDRDLKWALSVVIEEMGKVISLVRVLIEDIEGQHHAGKDDPDL